MPFEFDYDSELRLDAQVRIFTANQLERIADALEAKGAGDTALQGDVTASPQPRAPACSCASKQAGAERAEVPKGPQALGFNSPAPTSGGVPTLAAQVQPACSQCDDKGYTAVFEGVPQWCTCPRGAQYATEGRRAVYNDGKVV